MSRRISTIRSGALGSRYVHTEKGTYWLYQQQELIEIAKIYKNMRIEK